MRLDLAWDKPDYRPASTGASKSFLYAKKRPSRFIERACRILMSKKQAASAALPAFTSGSPIKLHGKLDIPSRKGSADLPERSAIASILVGDAVSQELIRSVELCMVECVEHLCTELKAHGFTEVPVLLHGKIPVLIARGAQLRDESLRIPEVERVGGILKRSYVEPAIDAGIGHVIARYDIRTAISSKLPESVVC